MIEIDPILLSVYARTFKSITDEVKTLNRSQRKKVAKYNKLKLLNSQRPI